jgi:hypothetical protein
MRIASLGLLALLSTTAFAEQTQIAPGLNYGEFECTVRGRQLRFRELRIEPGHGLELRAVSNPEARPNSRCRDGYGGTDLPTLLRNPDFVPGFQVLGATNGTLFHEASRRQADGPPVAGFASNSMLWSAAGVLLAPLRSAGGTHLLIADSQGGHELALAFEKCGHETCARYGTPPSAQAYTGRDLIARLRTQFPTMTLAIQSNMPLMGGTQDTHGRFTHYTACPAPGSNNWKCASNYRTVLCSRADGTLSLLTTPSAYPLELADGLRVRGACHAECVNFYNLDGGGSTQMAFLDPTSGSYTMSGRRIDTTQEGCSPYRPVDNYLVIGRQR